MTTIAGHLSVEALRDRYVSSADVMEARHFQTIWLLAKGHSVGDVAEMTSFGRRWIEQLVVRYNAEGPDSLGDMRRRNGARGARSEARSSREAAGSLEGAARRRRPVDERQGRSASSRANWAWTEVAVQRGWEALKACGMSIQTPRPKNPKSATPEEAAAFKKSLEDVVAEEAEKHPERPVEVFASDEHRLGLKPVTRRVWAPVGERPIAPGHHRFDWLYVTAFVSPASGETFWYVHDGVSKPFFSALLETFAREAGAGARPNHRARSRQRRLAWRSGARMSQTACGWSSCRPTRPNCNQPKRCGRWSTSPSSTNMSRPSTNSTTSSAKDAPPSPTNATPSKAEPASTGGRKSQARSDQPETVSDPY